MKRYLAFCILLIIMTSRAMAQGADFLNSTGKIYGVYTVVLILLLGLIAYLFSLDRKISKIEKSIGDG